MNGLLASHVVVLADLVDPTDDGVVSSMINYVLAGLMCLVALVGGWHGFRDWNGSSGTKSITILRDHAIGILAVEAFLGSILVIANEGTGFITSFF